MGKPVLLLRLEGPLQAWGSRARWDVRDTAPEPTKSGVVGLLGCALGYRSGDPRLETELDTGLRFGVRVESPGQVLEDYQTISGFLPAAQGGYRVQGQNNPVKEIGAHHGPYTIVSPRAYLQDAAFLIALDETGQAPGLLERCRRALEAPKWPVYLGRKACPPTRPVLEGLTAEYAGVEDALLRHPWSWHGSALAPRQPAKETLDIYIEDEAGALLRQDAVRTNEARQYGFRRARRREVLLAAVRPTGGDT